MIMPAQPVQSPPAGNPGRINRTLFDSANFPSTMEMPIRFDDLDVLWHVNNVAIIALLQEARVHFNREMALPMLAQGLRTVVGAMNVEYAGEMTYPGVVKIHSGISTIGRSSYAFAQLIRQNGQSAVYSQITMVVTDINGPTAIPDDFRGAIGKCSIGLG
jgi:acyl-CoA thioester hydrolase